MREILFFTGNEGKLAEARSALEPLGYQVIGRSCYAGLLRLLPPGVDRRAYFRGLLGFSHDGRWQVFEGRVEGEIVTEVGADEHGFASFPFDRIFRPAGSDVTMADLRWERRLAYSYRVNALNQLIAYLREGGSA